MLGIDKQYRYEGKLFVLTDRNKNAMALNKINVAKKFFFGRYIMICSCSMIEKNFSIMGKEFLFVPPSENECCC